MKLPSFLISNSAFYALVFCLVVSSRLVKSESKCSNNATSNFLELTARNGYLSEEHTVVTKDGYILKIFRIYRGKKYQGIVKSIPVLLVHGMFQDSRAWIDPGTDAGLAYLLSDAGYDTWIGNTRGNVYAMKHVTLNPEVDDSYWQFSADMMGAFDIPDMIDYVLNKTQAPKVNCIGFSQGGGSALMTFSEKPDYCDKVGVFIGLAPSSTIKYMTSLVGVILQTTAKYESLLSKIGVYKVFANSTLFQDTDARLCRYYKEPNRFCRMMFDVLDIPNVGSVTNKTYENICRHFPAPASIRTFVQYSQIILSGRFQKYNYGKEENLKIYGSPQAPEYDLSAVRVPTVLFQGLSDTVVDVKESKLLASKLPNLKELYIVIDQGWNHFDMTNSQHTKKQLYPKIIEYLSEYSK